MSAPRSLASTPHLLVGFAESLAAPESIWSLLDAGFRVTAFTRRGARPAIRRCPYIDVVEVEPPARDWQACLAQISELASSLGVAALMPFDDEAVCLCSEEAESTGAIVVGPTGDQARFAIDKMLQLEHAREAGFAVPESLVFETADEILSRSEVLPFPVVVKRALAVSTGARKGAGFPTTICADTSELRQLLASHEVAQPILVQPWLHGVGEGIFGLMAEGSRLIAASAHRRIRMVDPHGSGSSACVSILPDPRLLEITERMLAGVGWRGLFMVELLRTSETSWFMEFNGRTWGSTALARRLGFEYPAWAARERLFGDTSSSIPIDYPSITCRHLGFEIAHLLAVMKGPRSRAVTFPSRRQALCDFARVRHDERWYNLRPGCRWVFVDDTFQTALAPLVRRPAAGFPIAGGERAVRGSRPFGLVVRRHPCSAGDRYPVPAPRLRRHPHV